MKCVVVYDLKKGPPEEYTELIAALEKLQYNRHVQKSVWVVATELSSEVLYKQLRQHLKTGDKLLILQLANDGHHASDRSMMAELLQSEATRPAVVASPNTLKPSPAPTKPISPRSKS